MSRYSKHEGNTVADNHDNDDNIDDDDDHEVNMKNWKIPLQEKFLNIHVSC